MSLPGLRFPVDLSGGVPRFRNRRGALESIAIQVSLARLAEHLAPRVRNVLGPGPCELTVLPCAQGLTFGLHQQAGALAFNAIFAPDDDCVRWVVTDARSAGLDVHSHGAALRAVEAIAGRHGERRGSVVVFDHAIKRLVREVLIDAGARAPDTSLLRFANWQETQNGFEVAAQRLGAIPTPSPSVIRAIEAAGLAEDADNALARGDMDAARAGLLHALERAPRHPDLSLRLVEIDWLAQHRPDSALGLLVEAMPAVDAGLVAARLLAGCGDRDGAMAACRRASDREPFAKLASMLLVEASEYAHALRDRMSMLDEAVARSPGLESARWQRARARLALGDARSACADMEDIEASIQGSANRFEACFQAGRIMFEARMPADAARFYQKALRYLPASPDATAGLARALLATGDGDKAVALLSRAVSLAKRLPPPPPLLIELATALADIARDLPTAISHARAVPFGCSETTAARSLEGRWRAALGDLPGASQAFAQAREAAESMRAPADASTTWLVEAARFELDVRRDPRTAQQHLAAALRRDPQNSCARALFRSVGQEVARLDAQFASSQPQPMPQDAAPAAAPPSPTAQPHAEPDEDDEPQIQRLTQQVQGNPDDFEAVSRLCVLLNRTARHLDLFALVSARLEETRAPQDIALLKRYRTASLLALSEQARAAGRLDEAQLYEQALETPDSSSS
jgi:tetratricopeptide (TPR) repeat protein